MKASYSWAMYFKHDIDELSEHGPTFQEAAQASTAVASQPALAATAVASQPCHIDT